MSAAAARRRLDSVIGLWVQRRGASSGHWFKKDGRVHLADSAEKVLEVLRDGYDNAFDYSPKEYDGSEPEPAPPQRAPRHVDFMRGVRLRFCTDYDPDRGLAAQPGDCFFVPCVAPCMYWDNCTGSHLYVVCPDGRWWNVDSKASNCTMKDDRLHRCWIRHGDPARGDLTVDKDGRTCQAGAGSIDTGTYHGRLIGGVFSP